MIDPSVQIQAALTSVPSTPSWFAEVAVVAHAFKRFGLMKAMEERVRFVRARMGKYEMIDFVTMLIGYAVSGERTLRAFSERVHSPFLFRTSSLYHLFRIHSCLFISPISSSVPLPPVPKLLACLFSLACLQLVAYPVGPLIHL